RDRPGLHHFRADKLEADRCLEDRNAVNLTQTVDHPSARDGADERPSLAAVLKEVVAEEGEGLKLIDECTFFVDDAEAVSIPIGCKADVRPGGDDLAGKLGEVAGYGFRRRHAGESRVAFGPDLGHAGLT